MTTTKSFSRLTGENSPGNWEFENWDHLPSGSLSRILAGKYWMKAVLDIEIA